MQELNELIEQKNEIQSRINKVKIMKRVEYNKNGSCMIRVPNRFDNWVNSLLKERICIGKSPMTKIKAIELMMKHKNSIDIAEDIINFNQEEDIKIEK